MVYYVSSLGCISYVQREDGFNLHVCCFSFLNLKSCVQLLLCSAVVALFTSSTMLPTPTVTSHIHNVIALNLELIPCWTCSASLGHRHLQTLQEVQAVAGWVDRCPQQLWCRRALETEHSLLCWVTHCWGYTGFEYGRRWRIYVPTYRKNDTWNMTKDHS